MSTAATLLGTFEPGTDEWAAARADGLGGSEIAAVMGLSPFESPFSLWHRKAGLAVPVADNDQMYWGRLLEEPISGEFARRHPEHRMRRSGTWRNRHRPYQIATPDRLLDDGELLEAKTARLDDGWGDEGTDEIPVYYRAQCLWYLDALEAKRCHLAVLIAGSEYREYVVTYDRAEAAVMRQAAVEFLRTVRAGQRPPIDGHDQTYQVVRELHLDIEPIKVELPAAVAVPYLAALAACRDAEREKTRRAGQVLDAMGSAQRATYRDTEIATRVGGRSADKPPYLRAANGAADLARSTAA